MFRTGSRSISRALTPSQRRPRIISIHVDPTRAKETEFGGTIAHGFLCLSLLSRMAYDALPRMEAEVVILNYGLNRCRFISPIHSGSRVRGRFVLKTVAPKPVHELLTSYEATVEIEGGEKPALVAEWLVLVRL